MKDKWITVVLSLALAAGLFGVLPAPRALAATCTWTGSTSTLWATGSNWSGCGGNAPTSSDSAVIPAATNNPVISTSVTVASLEIQNGGVLTWSGGSGTTFSPIILIIRTGGKFIHTASSGSFTLPTSHTFEVGSIYEFGGTGNITSYKNFSYADVYINTTGAANNNASGNIQNVSGQLRVVTTGTGSFRLTGGTALTLNISKDLTILGGTLDLTNGAGAPTINIGGNFNQTGGTFISSGSVSTVVFTGGSSSFVTFATSGGTFTNTNINWQIASGKTVALNTNFGAGSWVAGGRTMTVNGAFQINQGAWPGNGGTWSYHPTTGTLIYNNSSGSYGVGNDNYWPATNGPVNVTVQSAGGITMNVARTVDGTFQTSAGVTNGNNLTLNGTAQINTGGSFASSPVYGATSTLVYNPGGSFNISNEWISGGTVGSGVPKNVTIQNSTAVVLPNGAGSRTVGGNLTIGNGSSLSLGTTIGDDLNVGGNWVNNGGFTANNRAVTFNGTTTVSGSSTTSFDFVTISGALTGHSTSMNVAKDWTNDGTFTHNNGAVRFNGTGTQTIGGSSISSFFDVFLEPASIVVVPVTTQPTVEGTLTNNGTLRQTKTVNNATVDFLNIKNSAGTTDKYFGVQVNTSNNLGNTVVSVSGNQTCSQANGYPVKRCFNVTPTTQAAANIKFYYQQNEMQTGQTYSSLNVWNYHSSMWNAVTRGADSGSCNSGAINCFVEGTGISTYSPFVLKNTNPTAVTLADFHAAQQGDAVLVTWETASELDNRGFNLYRGVSPDGWDRQLNTALIPSQSQGNPGGFVYTWEDRADLVPGTTYYYWLEDLDVSGATTLHGPVSVDFSVPTAVQVSGMSASPMAGSATLPMAGAMLMLLVPLAGALVLLRRRP